MFSEQSRGKKGQVAHFARVLMPNSSLKRSVNGRPPVPLRRYAVNFRQPGLGALPLAPA